MKVLLVHAHQEAKSFCSALQAAAVESLRAAGHEIVVSDLYRDGFKAEADRRDFALAADADYFKYQNEERQAWEQARFDGFAADIAREQRRLQWCEVLILNFPLYWFSVPAILKGWIDRVLAVGFAYGGGKWFETAPLYGRRALLSFTCGATPERFAEDALFGPLEHCLHGLHRGTLMFCGFEVLKPNVCWAPAGAGAERRAAYLADWRARLPGLLQETPLPFIRAADFARPKV